MLLDWTSAADIAAVRAASPGGAGYDLLLGADVAYGQQALPALFSCAAQLLARMPAAAFLLGESLIAWRDGGGCTLFVRAPDQRICSLAAVS